MTPQMLHREMAELEQTALVAADAEFQATHPRVEAGPEEAEYVERMRRVHRIFAVASRTERRWTA